MYCFIHLSSLILIIRWIFPRFRLERTGQFIFAMARLKMSRSLWLPIAAGCSVFFMACETGFAQDNSNEISGVRIYDAAFFARLNAQTALEMVQQVPGFAFQDTDQSTRGFSGAAGNVLINRARPNGKLDSLGDVLARIPARNVDRLELVRGGAVGYDTGRQSTVVNVVLRGETSTTRTLTATATIYDDQHVSPDLEFVKSRISARRNMTWSLEGRTDHHAWRGTERTIDAAGVLVGERRFEDPWTFEELNGSINLEQALGDRFLLGMQGRGRGFDFERSGVFVLFAPDSAGGMLEEFTDLSRTERWAQEYEFAPEMAVEINEFWRGELAALGRVYRFNDRSRSVSGVSGAVTNSRLVRNDREYLARAALFRSLDVGELQFGIEAAENSRDQAFRLTRLSEGVSNPIDLPGANAKVTETRYEMYGLGTWQIGDDWNLDGGVRYEWSTIAREGGDANRRSFYFLKPELRIRYQPSRQRQVLLNVIRDVSQLSFSDFLSQIDFNQDNQLNGGNPTLSPSPRWRADLTVEQSFAGGATATVTGFHEWISDVIDRAPVFDGAFDAPANVGSASRIGAELGFSMPLDLVGLAGGRLDLAARLADSSVTDPVTAAERSLSEEERWSVSLDYRQTVPAWNSTIRFSLSRAADRRIYRLDEIEIEPALTEAFLTIQTTAFDNLVVSLSADYLFEEEDDRTLQVFDSTRRGGVLERERIRKKRQGAFFTASLRYLF